MSAGPVRGAGFFIAVLLTNPAGPVAMEWTCCRGTMLSVAAVAAYWRDGFVVRFRRGEDARQVKRAALNDLGRHLGIFAPERFAVAPDPAKLTDASLQRNLRVEVSSLTAISMSTRSEQDLVLALPKEKRQRILATDNFWDSYDPRRT
jgi:hypothetical protein